MDNNATLWHVGQDSVLVWAIPMVLTVCIHEMGPLLLMADKCNRILPVFSNILPMLLLHAARTRVLGLSNSNADVLASWRVTSGDLKVNPAARHGRQKGSAHTELGQDTICF
eukprot:6255568-Amphidinium_carterae.2